MSAHEDLKQTDFSFIRARFEKDYAALVGMTDEDVKFMERLYKRILLMDALTGAIESFAEHMPKTQAILDALGEDGLAQYIRLGKKLEGLFNEP